MTVGTSNRLSLDMVALIHQIDIYGFFCLYIHI